MDRVQIGPVLVFPIAVVPLLIDRRNLTKARLTSYHIERAVEIVPFVFDLAGHYGTPALTLPHFHEPVNQLPLSSHQRPRGAEIWSCCAITLSSKRRRGRSLSPRAYCVRLSPLSGDTPQRPEEFGNAADRRRGRGSHHPAPEESAGWISNAPHLRSVTGWPHHRHSVPRFPVPRPPAPCAGLISVRLRTAHRTTTPPHRKTIRHKPAVALRSTRRPQGGKPPGTLFRWRPDPPPFLPSPIHSQHALGAWECHRPASVKGKFLPLRSSRSDPHRARFRTAFVQLRAVPVSTLDGSSVGRRRCLVVLISSKQKIRSFFVVR